MCRLLSALVYTTDGGAGGVDYSVRLAVEVDGGRRRQDDNWNRRRRGRWGGCDRRLPVEAAEALVRAVAYRANGLIILCRQGEECGMRRPFPHEDRGLPGGGRKYRREDVEDGWRANNVELTFVLIRRRWGGGRMRQCYRIPRCSWFVCFEGSATSGAARR